jgi:hypothetical protein
MYTYNIKLSEIVTAQKQDDTRTPVSHAAEYSASQTNSICKQLTTNCLIGTE